jgi:hypothetical protein
MSTPTEKKKRGRKKTTRACCGKCTNCLKNEKQGNTKSKCKAPPRTAAAIATASSAQPPTPLLNNAPPSPPWKLAMAADGTKRPRAAATRFGPDGLTESQILRRKRHREKYLRKSARAGGSLHVTFASDGESLEITHVWDHRRGAHKVFEDGNALLRGLRRRLL